MENLISASVVQTRNSFSHIAYLKKINCIVGLAVASTTAEQGVQGSIPESGKVLLNFSIKDLSVTVTESGFVPG